MDHVQVSVIPLHVNIMNALLYLMGITFDYHSLHGADRGWTMLGKVRHLELGLCNGL